MMLPLDTTAGVTGTGAVSLLPLHRADSPVAVGDGAPLDAGRLARDVASLCARLPERPFVANVCRDNYRFLVGLMAAAGRGQVTLLPHTTAPASFGSIVGERGDVPLLADGWVPVDGLEVLDLRDGADEPGDGSEPPALPALDARQVVAVPYTSGSTGAPVGHPKTWGFFVASARKIAAQVAARVGPGHAAVCTTPVQHLYGLENGLLAPLAAGGCLHPGRPYLPEEIRRALDAVPRPRVLVTTPPHLKVLLREGGALPPLDLIVSATAPLDREMAARAEERLGTPLMEIYGCTEAGSLAARETAREPAWRPLDGIRVEVRGEEGVVSGDHLEAPYPLTDRLEGTGDGGFTIRGRRSDMIKIGGKRGDLGDLTRRLGTAPGVAECVLCAPEAGDGENGRLEAFVVADPAVPDEAILAHLRRWVDPVFVPRRLVRVPEIPRNETGKVLRRALEELARGRGVTEA